MSKYSKYINALRECAKEHEHEITFTGHIIVSDLCRDTADLLEEVERESKTDVLDKIRAEIEPKCDRINSLASILPYAAHREIQELLYEIMDLCKAESSKTEQGLAYADQEAMMPAT